MQNLLHFRGNCFGNYVKLYVLVAECRFVLQVQELLHILLKVTKTASTQQLLCLCVCVCAHAREEIFSTSRPLNMASLRPPSTGGATFELSCHSLISGIGAAGRIIPLCERKEWNGAGLLGRQQTEELPVMPTHLHPSSAATDAELQNICPTSCSLPIRCCC